MMGHPERWKAEIVAGGLLAALGLGFVRLSLNLPPPDEAGIPGPGTVPLILGAFVAVSGLVMTAGAAFRQDRERMSILDRKQLIALLSLVAGALLFEKAGFVLATFAFLSVGFTLLGGADWRRAMPAAALVSLALWYLFVKLLGVGLPYGVIGEILFR
jgi:putative tricarboxylic transport membrane protein